MNKYELAIILHPDLEIDLEAPLQRIEKLISDAGGKVSTRDDWGKRKLAYPIKKQGFGLYFFYQLQLPAEKVTGLERNLTISDELLRHLLVKALPPAEEMEEKPKSTKTKTSTTKKADKVESASKDGR